MADNMEQPTLEDKKLKHPLLVIILVILGIIVFLAFHEFFTLLMMIGITVAVIMFVKRTHDKQRIQDEFKKNNFEEVLQNIFPGAQYFPKGENIDADRIRDYNLFRIDKKIMRLLSLKGQCLSILSSRSSRITCILFLMRRKMVR